MTDDLVNVEVDGVALKAKKGAMIIQVTDAHDAYVPRNLPRLDVRALTKQIETLHACVLVGYPR